MPLSDGIINFKKKHGGRIGWENGEKDNGVNCGYFCDVSGIFRGSHLLGRLKRGPEALDRSQVYLSITISRGWLRQ